MTVLAKMLGRAPAVPPPPGITILPDGRAQLPDGTLGTYDPASGTVTLLDGTVVGGASPGVTGTNVTVTSPGPPVDVTQMKDRLTVGAIAAVIGFVVGAGVGGMLAGPIGVRIGSLIGGAGAAWLGIKESA